MTDQTTQSAHEHRTRTRAPGGQELVALSKRNHIGIDIPPLRFVGNLLEFDGLRFEHALTFAALL